MVIAIIFIWSFSFLFAIVTMSNDFKCNQILENVVMLIFSLAFAPLILLASIYKGTFYEDILPAYNFIKDKFNRTFKKWDECVVFENNVKHPSRATNTCYSLYKGLMSGDFSVFLSLLSDAPNLILYRNILNQEPLAR